MGNLTNTTHHSSLFPNQEIIVPALDTSTRNGPRLAQIVQSSLSYSWQLLAAICFNINKKLQAFIQLQNAININKLLTRYFALAPCCSLMTSEMNCRHMAIKSDGRSCRKLMTSYIKQPFISLQDSFTPLAAKWPEIAKIAPNCRATDLELRSPPVRLGQWSFHVFHIESQGKISWLTMRAFSWEIWSSSRVANVFHWLFSSL